MFLIMVDVAQRVKTRFAPSPTGALHLGSARTALFNFLFARHYSGEYLLRIEDTDLERSTTEALHTIMTGLSWLGLSHDQEPISQKRRANRHQQIVKELLEKGLAYYCYSSPEEIQRMREIAKENGQPVTYNGYWRDRNPSEAPKDVKPTVRLKSKRNGSSKFNDMVQGPVIVENKQLDDMILLRSDGSPTYMLAVVVDDYDMGITHVIRGDDHLTNTFRQLQLYEALKWHPPLFAHLPLIHGPDGKKLSKRHGATNIEAYIEMGILPQAMVNYLLRLGWSHGDDEIISIEQAIKWFNTNSIGKSPARFDIEKLLNLNSYYIKQEEDKKLVCQIKPLIEKEHNIILSNKQLDLLEKGMPGLKERAKTLVELAKNAWFYVAPLPFCYENNSQKFLTEENIDCLERFISYLHKNSVAWQHDTLLEETRAFIKNTEIKMRDFSQLMRLALTGTTVSPSIFEIMEVLGKEESLYRLNFIKL